MDESKRFRGCRPTARSDSEAYAGASGATAFYSTLGSDKSLWHLSRHATLGDDSSIAWRPAAFDTRCICDVARLGGNEPRSCLQIL
jgi:hypothetical protein